MWVFIAYGMTSIIVWGSIFESTREWIKKNSKFFGDLVSCVLCTGTWVGFFLSLFLGSPTTHFFKTFALFNLFFDGMFAAGTVWAINAIIEYFEENRPK
jgi:hypothetical protein